MRSTGLEFREALARPGMREAGGAYDAMTARLVERAGFDAVLIGAGATANFAHGLPDIGLVSLSEIVENVARIAAVVSKPVIVDLDDGGGSPSSMRRIIRMAEQAGAAVVMVEDVDGRRKHLWSDETGGWDFASEPMMDATSAIRLMEAAVNARQSDHTVIMARTDAYPVLGLDETVSRIKAFADVGADMVLPSHVPIDLLNAEFCAEMRVPLVHMSLENQSLETRAAFDAAGIKLCAYQLPAFLAVVEAFQQALEDTRQGLRSPDGRSSVERNEVILDVVDLEGWSRLLRSTEGAPG